MTAKAIALFCGLVALGALLDLQVGLRPDLEPIPTEEMAEAVKALEAKRAPGDVIVHSPLLSVTELKPLGELRAKPDVPSPAVMGSRRVLVLDRSDARMAMPGRPETVERLTAHLELRLYAPKGDVDAPVYDLLSQLGPDVLHIERPIGKVSSQCRARRAEGGYQCPGEANWLYAAPRSLRIGGEERQCVWAHPTTGGAVVFTLPAPEPPAPGRDLVLELGGGLADDAVTGTPDGAPVYIDVKQGGRGLGRLTVPNRVGWRTLELGVEPGAPVVLSVTTPRDGRRHHCLDARIVDRPQGAK